MSEKGQPSFLLTGLMNQSPEEMNNIEVLEEILRLIFTYGKEKVDFGVILSTENIIILFTIIKFVSY